MNNKLDKVLVRQEALRELIRTYPIENQTKLVELLRSEYAISTNQSIVSRDLQELGVGKQKYQGIMVYELKEDNASKEILRLGVKEVLHNDSLIVVKTLAGLADFVGDYLDGQSVSGILATLAGENVVFVTPKLGVELSDVYKTVCKLLYFKHKESDL